MVENPVKDDLQPRLMAGRDKGRQVLVGAEAAVQKAIIGGLVAVPHRLKKRADINRREAQLFHMSDPRQQGIQPMHRLAVVILSGRPGEPQGVNMVKNSFIIPSHIRFLSFKYVCFSPV